MKIPLGKDEDISRKITITIGSEEFLQKNFNQLSRTSVGYPFTFRISVDSQPVEHRCSS
jgi:hypothetical protein